MAGKPGDGGDTNNANTTNTYTTTITAGKDRSGQGIANDWDYHMRAQGAAPGM